jgi:hypothetical protein
MTFIKSFYIIIDLSKYSFSTIAGHTNIYLSWSLLPTLPYKLYSYPFHLILAHNIIQQRIIQNPPSQTFTEFIVTKMPGCDLHHKSLINPKKPLSSVMPRILDIDPNHLLRQVHWDCYKRVLIKIISVSGCPLSFRVVRW